MAQDMVKEVADILCYYLGEKDKRGNIRLPEEYDELKSDLVKFYALQLSIGRIEGINEIAKQINEFNKNVQSETRNEAFKAREQSNFESKGGRANEGYEKRYGSSEAESKSE